MNDMARFIAPDLDDPRLREQRRYRMVIGGKSVEAASGATITRESPGHPGCIVGEWPQADRQDVEGAIAAARAAFDTGPWPRLSGAERSKLMFKVAELILAHQEELAVIESLEVGKPIADARGEIAGCADLWHYAAGQVRGLDGDTHNNLGPDQLGIVLREPIGVVGVITPWNFPLIIACERLPWAIGVGCTIVIKPSEFTSGTTIRLAELCLEAGIPAGVVNVVTGYGDPAGQTLAEDPRIDMVAFTGSVRVGKLLGAVAANTVKRVGLELGGKGPQVVFADADLAAAADGVAKGVLSNTGQVCISGSRLIVERSAADELVERVSNLMRQTVVGDPLDETVQVGSLISAAHMAKVEGHVADGIAAGARVVTGGARLGGNQGLYYAPTMFTGATPQMGIAREEIFGPVLTALSFDTPEQAIQLANDTAYGLSASVWSENIGKAFRTIRGIRAGRCWINNVLDGAPELPIGGYKQSGNGRETGRLGFDEYSEFKTILMSLGRPASWYSQV
jgi:acyl-CoA reductase-like NAD-dependent aldehyde dehydrogenase